VTGIQDFIHGLLTLNLLGTYLCDAHAGDIRKRDQVKLEDADAEEQGGHAFRVMEAYARALAAEGEKGRRALALLSLLGLFDRPATAGCLEALWRAPEIPELTEVFFRTKPEWLGLKKTQTPIDGPQRNLAIKRLEEAKLLSVTRDASGVLVALDAHPLLREYFARRLREGQPEAWRAAHKRLYEHLCATTHEGEQPTLDELQPLYQAVAHGCLAGLQKEARERVYRDRILRGAGPDGFYSTNKLGAIGSDLGAVACFFEVPWRRVSPALSEAIQAWLLNDAAFSLRALGRLSEALEPMRAALEMRVNAENWREAATSASNLSELELTLGELAAAVRDAEQAVAYADRRGDAFPSIGHCTTHADALHQAGRLAEAEARFREAEAMQAQKEPEYPLLYSLPGFRYCDLLLAGAERAAWKGMQNAEVRMQYAEGEACRDISERATKTLVWEEGWPNAPLLDCALHYLTLGRAGLYAAVLNASPIAPAAPEIEQAVAGLRRAGHLDELPKALLTRAWLRAVSGQRTGHESAQADLDEAWEIAERGPMPLFLADIHLHRARLFFRESPYPWLSPRNDLAEARRLIEKHGYWRRKEELEDAEEVVRGEIGPETSPLVASAALDVTQDEPTVSPMPIAYPTYMKTTSEQSTIILVTVNDHETQALFDAFVGPDGVPAQVTRQGVTYSELGIHGGLRIVNTICEMGAGSVGASQQRTREAIEHWKPKAIIAVGIAFGLDEEKQNIGDVLVSTHIQDYELGRLNANGTLTPRGAKPNSADGLCNRLRQVDSAERRRSNDWPKARFGVVLSGQKLVDNVDYRDSLKLLFPEAIGGEMEGTGVYVSASVAKVDWIVVKAICDWGHDKNVPDKDARQRSAAANAARVLKAALDIGGLYGEGAVPVATESSVDRNAIRVTSPVLEIWEKRLAFLLIEEAKLSDPVQKFSLAQNIAEARAKVREHGGSA
jgi:nucleoside phosphorylase/tetratricopeptide (TPR) repeat protein